jgi:AhpD family alkylhydroperoxidase
VRTLEPFKADATLSQRLQEVQQLLTRLRSDYPDLITPFLKFIRTVEDQGALDVKTKKLIEVALAVALKCEWCIAHHTKTALDAGASEAEVIEACGAAILMAGAPAMMATQLVLNAIDELKQ